MPKIMIGRTLAIGGALTLAAPAQASLNDQFACDAVGDGQFIVTIMAMDSNTASVRYQLSGDYADQSSPAAPEKLSKVETASGLKYTGSGYTFEIKDPEDANGSKGFLTYAISPTGKDSVACHFAGDPGEQEDVAREDNGGEASADAAGSPHDPIEMPGESWGGRLRSGPGMDYDQIGSMAESDSGTIVQNTGIAINGYDWFRIRTAGGKEGFQWGGIVCPLTADVRGTFGFGECPSDIAKPQTPASPGNDDVGKTTQIRITGFECGDNCYPNFSPLGANQPASDPQSALCTVGACEDWFMEQDMPASFIGRTATVTLGIGSQVDNAGTVMSSDFPEIKSLVIDPVK